MAILLLVLGVGAATLAGLTWLAILGVRDGDRPLDVVVRAELHHAGQPDERRPVVVAEVRNPSAAPVLAGLVARRAVLPGWLAGRMAVTTPRRTRRRGLRPSRYETVGVVAAGVAVRFTVPVARDGRAYWLTVAAGQSGGRLRLHRLLVDQRTRLRLPVPDLTR
ncbi:MAG TPA: hypothetical protein VH478_13725 [Trebonia sp.]|jgi:hypothetical protein|nr:hypothetical protein [Trebonia sp.]